MSKLTNTAAALMGAAIATMPFANTNAGEAQAATIPPAHPLLDSQDLAGTLYRIGFCSAASHVIPGGDGAQACRAVVVGLDEALEAGEQYAGIVSNKESAPEADIAILSPGSNDAYIPFCMRHVDSDRPATGAISPTEGDLYFFDTGYRGDCAGYFNTQAAPWEIADGNLVPKEPSWNPDLTDPFGNPKQLSHSLQ